MENLMAEELLAFPSDSESDIGGMTLGDYFAAKAMTALIASGDIRPADDFDAADVAIASYRIADAMLEARKL